MENKTPRPALAVDRPQDLTERQLLVLDEISRIGASMLAVADARARSGTMGADKMALAVEMIRRTVRRTDAMRLRIREQATRAAARAAAERAAIERSAALAAAGRDRPGGQGPAAKGRAVVFAKPGPSLAESLIKARLERDFFRDAPTDTSRPRGRLH